MKKILMSMFLFSMVLILPISIVGATQAEKVDSMIISGNGYTWAMARLIVTYDTSTKKIKGANTERRYTFIGATNVKNYVKSLEDFEAVGYLQATVGGIQKISTVTVRTK